MHYASQAIIHYINKDNNLVGCVKMKLYYRRIQARILDDIRSISSIETEQYSWQQWILNCAKCKKKTLIALIEFKIILFYIIQIMKYLLSQSFNQFSI